MMRPTLARLLERCPRCAHGVPLHTINAHRVRLNPPAPYDEWARYPGSAARRRYSSTMRAAQPQHIQEALDRSDSADPVVPSDRTSALRDTFGRDHTYLRVSLTEKCNLRCKYCMPEEGVPLAPPSHLLRDDEIVRLASIFVRHGITKVRLTGGEPLVRPKVVDLAREIAAIPGVRTLALTTNGLVLKRKAPELRRAGVTAMNISLDSLVAPKFELITRRKGHHAVLEGLHVALDSGFESVKLNVVVIRGFNDDELAQFCELTRDNDLDVRFIEYMPFGGNRWNDSRFMSYADMLRQVGMHFGSLTRIQDSPNDTCKHYRVPGYRGRIGFITSMTNHFCGSCNRLRLTADGNIKACLFGTQELSLRDAMRDGATDDDLVRVIARAVSAKHFSLGGNRDMYDISKQDNRSMIRIGG